MSKLSKELLTLIYSKKLEFYKSYMQAFLRISAKIFAEYN